MSLSRRVAALLAISLALACSKQVEFDSNPRGARVWVNGRYVGQTPTSGSFSYTAFTTFDVVLAKEGYQTHYGHLAEDLNIPALVCGVAVCWPLLIWVQSPMDHYSFGLQAGSGPEAVELPGTPGEPPIPTPWPVSTPVPR